MRQFLDTVRSPNRNRVIHLAINKLTGISQQLDGFFLKFTRSILLFFGIEDPSTNLLYSIYVVIYVRGDSEEETPVKWKMLNKRMEVRSK